MTATAVGAALRAVARGAVVVATRVEGGRAPAAVVERFETAQLLGAAEGFGAAGELGAAHLLGAAGLDLALHVDATVNAAVLPRLHGRLRGDVHGAGLHGHRRGDLLRVGDHGDRERGEDGGGGEERAEVHARLLWLGAVTGSDALPTHGAARVPGANASNLRPSRGPSRRDVTAANDTCQPARRRALEPARVGDERAARDVGRRVRVRGRVARDAVVDVATRGDRGVATRRGSRQSGPGEEPTAEGGAGDGTESAGAGGRRRRGERDSRAATASTSTLNGAKRMEHDDLLGAQGLLTATQHISRATTREEVHARVCRAARELAAAEGATLVVREDDWCLHVEEDAATPLAKGRRATTSECAAGWAMVHLRPAVIEDVDADERARGDAYRSCPVRSLVMVPVGRADAVGALGCFWSARHVATRREVVLLEALAESAVIALDSVARFRAIEDRARAREEELAESFRAAQEQHLALVKKALSAFLGGLVNDINTKLTVILGIGTELVEQLGAGHPLGIDAEEVVESAQRCAKLTHAALEFRRSPEFDALFTGTTSRASPSDEGAETTRAPTGDEAILLVGFPGPMQDAIERMLRRFGYCVLAADDEVEARSRIEEDTPRVDLILISDDGMDASCVAAASRLTAARPGLRALVVVKRGRPQAPVEEGALPLPFLESPVTAMAISKKVREVLDAARR